MLCIGYCCPLNWLQCDQWRSLMAVMTAGTDLGLEVWSEEALQRRYQWGLLTCFHSDSRSHQAHNDNTQRKHYGWGELLKNAKVCQHMINFSFIKTEIWGDFAVIHWWLDRNLNRIQNRSLVPVIKLWSRQGIWTWLPLKIISVDVLNRRHYP